MRETMAAHRRHDHRERELGTEDRRRKIGLQHARKEMRFDRGRLHRAQVLALGPFGPGTTEDVAIAAFGQDLLGFYFELRGVDDTELLYLRAAAVLNLLIARKHAAAARRARREIRSRRRLRERRYCCNSRHCHCRAEKEIPSLNVHVFLPCCAVQTIAAGAMRSRVIDLMLGQPASCMTM